MELRSGMPEVVAGFVAGDSEAGGDAQQGGSGMKRTDLHAAMKLRHPPEAWCLMWEVAEATGGSGTRRADAVAVSLWPSRGLHIHGYEFKRTRSDWLRELKNPAKAEAVCRYCHFWSVVIDDASIVKIDELPVPWGLLVPDGKGGLKTAKRAVQVKPVSVDMGFVAALMRSAMKPADKEISGLLEREYLRGKEHGEETWKLVADQATKSLERLQAEVHEFEEAAGFRIRPFRVESRRVGEVVRDVLAGKYDRDRDELLQIRETAKSILDRIDQSGLLSREALCESSRAVSEGVSST